MDIYYETDTAVQDTFVTAILFSASSDASANVLACINPIFAGITLVTYGIRKVVGLCSNESIIDRINLEKSYAKKGYYEYSDIAFSELFSSYFPLNIS